MKIHYTAILILLVIVVLVCANAWYICDTADAYLATWSTLQVPQHVDGLLPMVQSFREEYVRFERIVSLTVSHEDLTNIATALSDLQGAALGDDRAAFLQAKCRLTDALAHLKRQNGCSVYSIF